MFKEPFEELLREQDLPSKLNEIDSFLRQRRTTNANVPNLSMKNFTPEQLLKMKMAAPKRAALEHLRAQVENLEWRNSHRTTEIGSRKEALARRLDHVRDTQKLYDQAFNQVINGSSGELEVLVDRMIHQSIPESASL